MNIYKNTLYTNQENDVHGLIISNGYDNATMVFGSDTVNNIGYIGVSSTGSYGTVALNPRGGSVCIGGTNTTETLDVFGSTRIQGTFSCGIPLSTISAASWGTTGLQSNYNATTYIDTTASGTISNAVINSIQTPFIEATNVGTTVTNAATLYIDGNPIAGNNMSFTNSYALWVNGTIKTTTLSTINPIDSIYGGTGFNTYAQGTILAGITDGSLTTVPVSTYNGYSLTADSTAVAGVSYSTGMTKYYTYLSPITYLSSTTYTFKNFIGVASNAPNIINIESAGITINLNTTRLNGLDLSVNNYTGTIYPAAATTSIVGIDSSITL